MVVSWDLDSQALPLTCSGTCHIPCLASVSLSVTGEMAPLPLTVDITWLGSL